MNSHDAADAFPLSTHRACAHAQAPELWASREVEYNSSVDLWALGVVTYLLLTGRRPFDHPNREVIRSH